MTNATPNRWYSSDTQICWACKSLISDRVITHKTEIREVNAWRLSAIIHRLRTEYKWPIETEFRGKENIAHYRLAAGATVANLRFPPSAAKLQTGEPAQ